MSEIDPIQSPEAYVAVFLQDGQPVRVGPYRSLWDLGREFDMDELEAERLGQGEGWNPASVAAWLAGLLGLPEGAVQIETTGDEARRAAFARWLGGGPYAV